MVTRRDLIATGALFSPLRPAEAGAAQRGGSGDDSAALHDIRDELRELRAVRRPVETAEIVRIREAQRGFLRANHKFPDVIEIGIQVWERLHSWHIENRQEMRLSRSPEGRLQMEFMLTALILRTDLADTWIGTPFDR
jgi:hypothetical protein